MTQSPEALLQELEQDDTTHQRRKEIGETLAKIGDARSGIGTKNGIPDIHWLPVAPGGTVIVKRVWHPDTPDDEYRVLSEDAFTVEPFYIAKYATTYAQYQAFVDEEDGFNNPDWWRGMPETYQCQALAEQRIKQSNNPRDTISWYQCVAFARWLNHQLEGLELPHPADESMMRVGDNAQVRLPTESEWQWAAQSGEKALPFPWGHEAKSTYANTQESGLRQAIAVGMYPHAAPDCGALDMTGNLMEWCANDKKNMGNVDARTAVSKVLRGGDWGFELEYAKTTYVDDDMPHLIDALNGFRLVISSILFA